MDEHLKKDDLERRVAELAVKFLQRTMSAAASLPGLMAGAHRGDLAAIDELEHTVHRIHGGGATFGFNTVSERAREFERLIVRVKAHSIASSGIAAPMLRRMHGCARRLTQEIDVAVLRQGFKSLSH
jgi:chemotaxis protein histidine kinase CheA